MSKARMEGVWGSFLLHEDLESNLSMLSLESSDGLRAVGEPMLGRKSQCGLLSPQKGWAVYLEWPELLPTQPTLPKSVQVLKPALFKHLLSTEHTREEAKASRPLLAYEKYNKGSWAQQLGSYAEAAGTAPVGTVA